MQASGQASLSKDASIHIIGQGLAGSVMAFRLIEAGYRPLVFDRGLANASSMVAAGMWNPVNFKRLNVGKHPELYIESMYEVYQRMETWLGVSFFRPLPIIRLYDSREEVHQWDLHEAMGKSGASYLSNPSHPVSDARVRHMHGAGLVQEGGRVNLPVMLHAMRARLQAEGLLRETTHEEDPQALTIHCSGMDVKAHPYWQWLPMAPNKGQVLTVRIPDFDTAHIYHFGRFVVPMEGDEYKLGSTYELNPHNALPDDEKGLEIMQDCNKTLEVDTTIVSHKAGYRPTTFDRMPIVGRHPERMNHYVFGGFGSRGVYYVPLCSARMIDFLIHGTDLPREIGTSRLTKYYKTSSDTEK
jgi:glycine oxidase